MTVTLSQDTYDAMLDDLKKLRERNKDLEHENKSLRLQATSYFDKWAESMRKTNAFDEVLNVSKFQHEEEYADEVLEIINKYKEEQND